MDQRPFVEQFFLSAGFGGTAALLAAIIAALLTPRRLKYDRENDRENRLHDERRRHEDRLREDQLRWLVNRQEAYVRWLTARTRLSLVETDYERLLLSRPVRDAKAFDAEWKRRVAPILSELTDAQMTLQLVAPEEVVTLSGQAYKALADYLEVFHSALPSQLLRFKRHQRQRFTEELERANEARYASEELFMVAARADLYHDAFSLPVDVRRVGQEARPLAK